MTVFIKPFEVYAVNNAVLNSCIISETKTDIISIKELEKHYIVTPNNNETFIFKTSDKNRDLSIGTNNGVLAENNLRYFLSIKSANEYNYLSHNSSLNLKNSLYIRAP